MIPGPARRRATVFASFLAQAILLLAAAALAQSRAVPAFAQARLSPTPTTEQETARRALEDTPLTMLPLALLAFQFGGQIVASRVLACTEVPTNVLTSLYCDLLSDPALLAGWAANAKRNRRVAAAVLTVAGGVAGGWLQRSAAGMGAALWIAGAIKLAVALAWLGWGAEAATAKNAVAV